MRDFHEGTRVGFVGDFFELFQTPEELDMFACGACGHVEFFIGGVGDELRGFKINGRVGKRRLRTGRPAGQGH